MTAVKLIRYGNGLLRYYIMLDYVFLSKGKFIRTLGLYSKTVCILEDFFCRSLTC